MDRVYSTKERCENYTTYYSGNLNNKDHFGDMGIDRRIILKCALKELNVRKWTEFICLKGSVTGFCERYNKPLCLQKSRNSLRS